MFWVICWVSSRTVREPYCWDSLEKRGTKPTMKKCRQWNGIRFNFKFTEVRGKLPVESLSVCDTIDCGRYQTVKVTNYIKREHMYEWSPSCLHIQNKHAQQNSLKKSHIKEQGVHSTRKYKEVCTYTRTHQWRAEYTINQKLESNMFFSTLTQKENYQWYEIVFIFKVQAF